MESPSLQFKAAQLGGGTMLNGEDQGESDRVRVSVIVPTLNEADNLRFVLTALPDLVEEVLIVDGGSTDGTVDEARRLRHDVRIIEELRPGKGRALRTGFEEATGDILVMIDADMPPISANRWRSVRAISSWSLVRSAVGVRAT